MKKVIVIILFIICSSLAYAGFLISSNNKKLVAYDIKNNEEYGVINTIDLNGQSVTYYDQLYLRNDNTFYLSINSYYLDKIIIGTYAINANFLTLNQRVLYSNNGCFYKDEEKTFVADIEGDKILLEYNGIKKEFVRNVGVSETDNNRKYYVLDPISDSSPDGILNTWIDCSKKLTKK